MENNKNDAKVKKTYKEQQAEFAAKHPEVAKVLNIGKKASLVLIGAGAALFLAGCKKSRSMTVHEDIIDNNSEEE